MTADKPYNVNKAREARLRNSGGTWPFELDGKRYTFPTELTREAASELRQLDDNDVDGLLRLLLGEDQYRFFEGHPLTMQDIAGLLEAYGRDTGLGLP